MKIRSRMFSSSIVTLAMAGASAYAQTPAFLPQPPLPYPMAKELQNNPEALRQIQTQVPVPRGEAPGPSGPVVSGTWQRLVNLPGQFAANPLLLTDGTVIVHIINSSFRGTQAWRRLTPSINSSLNLNATYRNGAWSSIGSLPNGYAPIFFASAVLPDGRVIAEGGEYNGNDNGGNGVWTNKGAIYNNLTNVWNSVTPPAGWTRIGDAQSVVLPAKTRAGNFAFMLANCCDFSPPFRQALLNPNTLTWTTTGAGQADDNDEGGWALLHDGSVLDVEAYVNFFPNCPANPTGSERYLPSTGTWSSAGSTIVKLPDCGPPNKSYELGPIAVRPNGTAIAFGGTTSGAAHSSIFTPATNPSGGTWKPGPNIPSVGGVPYTLADAPSATLPDGNVLFAASPSDWQTHGRFPAPTHFFEFDGTSFAQVADNADAPATNSFYWNFLVLPTGQVLATETYGPNVFLYTTAGSAIAASAPAISTISSTTLHVGSTYTVTGHQFNGLTQGAAYGDDAQAATNYPIVRIVNRKSHHVYYARSFNFNTLSIKPGTASAASFTVLNNILGTDRGRNGASFLYVVANGIPSNAVAVTIP